MVAFSLTACTGSSNKSANGSSSQLDTLQHVLSTKTLRVGVIANVPPNGYYDDKNNFVGFDPDLAAMLAADLGVQLKLTVLANSAARESSLIAGDEDLVAADFAVTPARAEVIDFSIPYMVAPLVLVGRQGDGITDYNDLGGHTVGIVTGTTQEILATIAPKDAKIVRFGTDAAMRQAFVSKQIDAHLAGQNVAETEVKDVPGAEIKGIVSNQDVSLGVPKNDQNWLNWVNWALTYHGERGELGALYQKWFNEPMPKVLPDF